MAEKTVSQLVLGLATNGSAVEGLQPLAHAARLRALHQHGSRVLLALAFNSPSSAIGRFVLTDSGANAARSSTFGVHVLRVAQALVVEIPDSARRRILVLALRRSGGLADAA